MSFGILTLATRSDYLKAIGLALSVRVSNPGVPIAVVCSPKLRTVLSPHFDCVVDENPLLRGFVHKLHLDRYSPFDETFFFDSDVLVFRNLQDTIGDWRRQPYTACGDYVAGGVSPFGLNHDRVLRRVGRDKLVHIDGAGHAYFRKPECHQLFDLARTIADNYQEYSETPANFADEDVIDIAMTILNLEPMPHGEFWSRHCSARRGTLLMNATRGECSFRSATSGEIQRPLMMHFAAREAPLFYGAQLRRLFAKFKVSSEGLFRLTASEFYIRHIKWPLRGFAKRFLTRLGFFIPSSQLR